MYKTSKVVLVFLLLVRTTSFSQCTSPSSSISSPYNSNNGQRGAMFDITATNAVTILCFDANLYAGTTANYEIYYKSGSYIGFETNAAAWTLVGSTTGLASLGNNTPTPIPIMVNVGIPAGQTYAFYITNDFGAGLSYTDGTSGTALLASDANISMNGGIGKSYPFGLTFAYRYINTHAHYVPGIALPVELSSFWATPLDKNVRLDWTTLNETNNDYFTLERSRDGNDWEEVTTQAGHGNSSEQIDYSFMDRNPYWGVSYYRISQTDFDGTVKYYSDVKSVNMTSPEIGKLIVSPNPAEEKIEIIGSRDELGEITIIDFMGRDLTPYSKTSYEDFIVSIDIKNVPANMFILKCGERTTLVTKK